MAQVKHPLVQAQDAARRLDAEQVFLATVVTVSGNQVLVMRNDGRGEPEGQYYASQRGIAATLSPGDTVSVARHGAGWVVQYAVDS